MKTYLVAGFCLIGKLISILFSDFCCNVSSFLKGGIKKMMIIFFLGFGMLCYAVVCSFDLWFFSVFFRMLTVGFLE